MCDKRGWLPPMPTERKGASRGLSKGDEIWTISSIAMVERIS
jgi:hypothetical protein